MALKVGRLDLLRGTVRLLRSLAEELGAYLAGRPTGRDELVFTAPRGGPLRESKFVPDRFKPAIAATNQGFTYVRTVVLPHNPSGALFQRPAQRVPTPHLEEVESLTG